MPRLPPLQCKGSRDDHRTKHQKACKAETKRVYCRSANCLRMNNVWGAWDPAGRAEPGETQQ